jgi:DNA helicase-2/ATP-dependent DNA helicase PcrA
VIEASAASPPPVVERLHRAWRERERVVIVWSGGLPDLDPVLVVPFHQLDPIDELPGERLRFAVCANAVHLLGDSPRFEPIERAVALGATVDGPGDVVLADRRAVWVDGGPMDPLAGVELDQLPVVPRPHLIAGRLQPVGPDPSPPSAELAPDQLAAVGHRGGPARIIAPAGSGKTRVLTERTRHLVNDRGLHPAAVSLVAYNRRARQQMVERLVDVAGLDIRTLNSLALAIATGRGPFASPARARGVETITEIDARRVLERLVPGRRRRSLTDPLEPWIDALSACRLGLRDPDEVEGAYGGDIAGFGEVLDQYRDELLRRGQLDYDEQILRAVEVLLTDPEARAAARRAAPVLLVDEFQDLTPAHLLLVRLLAGPAGEVFAVGDDDQTIYGYSGASPDWLVGFSLYFPGAADHALTVNYRCPAPVVDAATKLLSHNRNRVAKTIRPAPDRRAGGSGSELAVNTVTDPQQALVDQVGRLVGAGARPSEVAVLARVNAALLPAAVHLTVAGHPVAKPPGLGSHLLDRSGTGAALAWLRLASCGEQRLAAGDLRLALRRPPRSLHPRIADWVCEQRSVKDLLALSGRLNKEREAETVASLAADIERLRRGAQQGLGAAELLDVVYRDIGLLGAATQLDQSQRTARRPAHADELAALRAAAQIGPGPAELEGWLRDLLDGLPQPREDVSLDVITLATVHSTKGLEWPHVVVHDVRADLYPHSLADDIEEERRIFHVALTRCRASVLVNAGPPGAGPPISPFVAELERARPVSESPDLLSNPGSPGPVPAPGLLAQPARRRPGSPAGGTGRAGNGNTNGKGNGDAGKPVRAEPRSETEVALRAALTEWRTTRCRTDGVPAYIVLGNATLDAIAAASPTSLAALGRIKGIGPAKLERYGADILGIVADQIG